MDHVERILNILISTLAATARSQIFDKAATSHSGSTAGGAATSGAPGIRGAGQRRALRGRPRAQTTFRWWS